MADIIGYLDGCDDGLVTGWAARASDPQPVTVTICLDGEPVGSTLAGLFREDLRSAGIGEGRHGFQFEIPPSLRRAEYEIAAHETATATPLGRSPLSVKEEPHLVLRGARLRRFLGEQYFTGEGLEVGALHRPMPLPGAVRVTYADSFPTDTLVKLWSPEVDGHVVVPVDIVTDATTLAGVGDASFDFVIASHVVEHLEDPISSVLNLVRVTKPGGCVFLAIPDRRCTFDAKRPPTPIEHVVRDYCGSPERSRRAHYDEWVRLVEGLSGEAAAARAGALETERYPIHFHVWQPSEFTSLLDEIRGLSTVPFELDIYKANPPEGIWILRRS